MNDREFLFERDTGDDLGGLELKIPGAIQDFPLSRTGDVEGVLIRIFRGRKTIEIIQ